MGRTAGRSKPGEGLNTLTFAGAEELMFGLKFWFEVGSSASRALH